MTRRSKLAGPISFVVPAIAAVVLLAAAIGLVPAGSTAATSVGVTALWAAVRLLRAAYRAATRPPGRADVHSLGRAADSNAAHPAKPGHSRAHRVSPGAVSLGLGALTAALAALTAGLFAWVPAWEPPAGRVYLMVAFGLITTLLALGVMLLPTATPIGPAPTAETPTAETPTPATSPGTGAGWAVHTRRAFDGAGLGVSLAFAAYLLPPPDASPAGPEHLDTLPIVLPAAIGIAIAAVTMLRARPRRPAVVLGGSGVILVLLGLGALCMQLLTGAAGRPAAVAGLPVVAGLAVIAAGGTRPYEQRQPDRYLASYPLLAVPAGVGVIAALWHLVVAGTFDTTGIILGISMVAVLVMRELLVVRDIRRYAGQLATAEAHFRSLVAGATDLTLVLDDDLRVRWQSPAASRLFGLSDDEVVGRAFADLIHPEDVEAAQEAIDAVMSAGEPGDGPPLLVAARMRDGAALWRDTESTISDQRSVPEVAALVVHVRDIGERRHLERTLHRLSWTDQLTGLANHRALMRDLLTYRRRAGQQGTLLVIDLYGLAEINDNLGRTVGDAVLVEVGRRIRGLLGPDDVPARLAGDEFAVLTGDGAVLAYAMATRIATLLAEPIELPGVVAGLHTSIGLAELADGADSEEVLRHADLARKRAHQLGPDRVEWYDPDVEMKLNRRMDLEQQLLGAAERGELDLVFQPVVDLPGRSAAGVEALLRWRHPELGTILPGELLPIARAVGITAELDEWLLDTACRQLAAWTSEGNDLWLSVNIASNELLTVRFPERVTAALRRYGVAPERLVIEVPESGIAEDVPAVVAALAGLRKLGVRAALDDFGAGQASLSHLRRLPVDMLKLHTSLMNGGDRAVLDVVVSLSRRLGLMIVAKGLESEEQIERAAAAGCPYGQGMALGGPAPAERTEAFLESHRN